MAIILDMSKITIVIIDYRDYNLTLLENKGYIDRLYLYYIIISYLIRLFPLIDNIIIINYYLVIFNLVYYSYLKFFNLNYFLLFDKSNILFFEENLLKLSRFTLL